MPRVFVIKAFGFVLGYNGSARAVRIYHIKSPCKKGVAAQRGFGSSETLEAMSLITCIRALGFCGLARSYCSTTHYSPRSFCCGTSRADPQTPPPSAQEQPDERDSGLGAPSKPQSHCDIQHCRELLTAYVSWVCEIMQHLRLRRIVNWQ